MSAYLDGELEGAARERLVMHLEACTACKAEYAELERVHLLFARAERYDAPPTFSWRVAAARRSGDTLRRPLFPVAIRVAAQVAAFTIVVALGVVSGSFLAVGPAAERAANPATLLSLDIFAAAPPDSPGGVYLALTEADRE
jgi:anti-sigma factor RsiW